MKDLISFICYGLDCKPIHVFIPTTKAEPEPINLDIVNHYLVVQIAAADMLSQYVCVFDIKMELEEEDTFSVVKSHNRDSPTLTLIELGHHFKVRSN